MTEEQRQRAIRLRLARSEARGRGVLATGLAELDSALDGGFPRGGIVELFGPPSSGKSSLALRMVAHTQRSGGTAAWLDAEHVFDAAYADSLGVQVGKMPLAQPQSAEQALEMASKLAGSGAIDLLIVDSAAALVPRLELESGVGASGSGLHSRVLASGLRKLARDAARSGAAVVFLNQTRSWRQAAGGGEESSAGGPPLKLYAAVRLVLAAGTGGRVHFRVLKNKAAAAFREGEFIKSP